MANNKFLCYPELINFLYCPTLHCPPLLNSEALERSDERTGWKAVINLSRPDCSSLLSVSSAMNEILIGEEA